MAADSTLKVTLHFLAREKLYEHEKPYSIQFEPHGDVPRSNVRQTIVEDMNIQDIRSTRDLLRLESDGFIVRDLHSAMSYTDFADPEIVQRVYLEEVRTLLAQSLGTKNVAILEYLVRSDLGGSLFLTDETIGP